MTLLIGFLTFILVVNCLFLMLLILIQLPKKEAGAGIAFGGAATDALFGAGSGNALTKMTKYAGTLFVGMSVLLSMLNMQAANRSKLRLEKELSKQASVAVPGASVTPSKATSQTIVAPSNTAAPKPVTLPSTNLLLSTATNQAKSAPPAVSAEAPAPAPAAPPAAPSTPATPPAK